MPAPFDPVAYRYDADFTNTPLGRRQRELVQRYLEPIIHPGMRVLELNCGTGEDALWMAARGAHVTATDISAGMLEVASNKATNAGATITFRQLRLEDVGLLELPPDHPGFDLVFSNFDGLNCLPTLDFFPDAVARLLRPGGGVMVVWMNPMCAAELVGFSLRGRFGMAVQRLRRGGVAAHIGDGETAQTWFHSIWKVKRAFAKRFRFRTIAAIGLTTPPTLMRDWYHRHQRLFRWFFPIEERLMGLFPLNRLGDHTLLHCLLKNDVPESPSSGANKPQS